MVLDVKDATGYLTYTVNVPLAEQIGANNQIKVRNIDDLINKFHKENIYVIGRVQVFQDPVLATGRPDIAIKETKTGKVWKDNKGLAWIDPSSRIAWQYNIDIGKDMAGHGFDEINFDYVRFPSDGETNKMDYPFWNAVQPKYELIGSFFCILKPRIKKFQCANFRRYFWTCRMASYGF